MLYINNQWLEGKAKSFQSINPFNGEIIWEGNFADITQMKSAVSTAYKSHESWSSQSVKLRIKII